MTPRALVEAWRACRAAGVDVLTPGASGHLQDVLGLSTAADVTATLAAVRALEVVERERVVVSTATFVGTRPKPKPHEGGTRGALRALIASAERELLVVGFSMTDAEVERLVHERSKRAVRVTLVGDRTQEGVVEWVKRWPSVIPRPIALIGVEPDVGEPYFVHGKAVVADRTRALIGSANFTGGGLQSNVELGVLVEGRAATEVVEFIERLALDRWLVNVIGS